MTIDKENIELSLEEQQVLNYWSQGYSMTDAYKAVMLTPHDADAISEVALKKRVIRFFNTYRMRMAMAQTPGERGKKAKKEFSKWEKRIRKQTARELGVRGRNEDLRKLTNSDEEKTSRKVLKPLKKIKKYASEDEQDEDKPKKKKKNEVDKTTKDTASKSDLNVAPTIDFEVKSDVAVDDIVQNKTIASSKSDKEEWIESLNVNKNPSSMTIYGTGQFIVYLAVKEIMARQAEIKKENISPLDKNGSAFTPTIISALKTAAAMILPFAPAPSISDRREMSKAAVLLGLMPDKIGESPDDYTAPIPNAIEIETDNKEQQS